MVEYDVVELMGNFIKFCKVNGLRQSDLTNVLNQCIDPDLVDTPMDCMCLSTPPQEGKTTWIAHFIAWQMIRNPWLKVVYATYSQSRANSVSRQIRSIVQQFTPLKSGSSNVQRWETRQGGGLLAAGRGSAMTGFSSDLTIIDDPIKDMVEAQSKTIREQTVEWFNSVVLTRMASLSQVIIVATRWHKDDLIAHAIKSMDAEFINIPAQAVDDEDILYRKPGEWLSSVQNRSPEAWERIKKAVGTYVWQALYQGDPQVTGGSYIHTDKIDVIPWDQVVIRDANGFLRTHENATVIQSWDLAFTGKGDYVAGQVWARIGKTWVLLDRIHKRASFTETLTLVQTTSARWIQTSRIYVENAANGAALIDTLKKSVSMITPVTPRGSKESRALAVQPYIDQGLVKVVDAAYDEQFFTELQEFPFYKHDDQVDSMTQALLSARSDFFQMGD